MSIVSINLGKMNTDYMSSSEASKESGVKSQLKSISFSGIGASNDAIAERRKEGQKMAWKVVSDAWKSDQSIDQSITSRRDHYYEMSAIRDEATEVLSGINKDEDALQEQYGVADDSEEQQDLELLKREQNVKSGLDNEPLTKDELNKLAELHEGGLTEYQEQALELNDRANTQRIKIRDANAAMRDDVSDINAIKLERLKSHGMVDAQNSADEIMAATNDEIMSMAVQDAMDHIDEQMEEVQEKAEEAAEKKEEKDEQLEEQKLERKIREAMIEGTQEAIEEAEALARQNDSIDFDITDMLDVTGDSLTKTTNGAADSLSEIKSSMKLLEADLKGIKVDEEA